MDESVIRAMTKWPKVPAVYGWLSLDRRGAWRLKGETIPNRAVVEFIGRNYASDRQGRWYFQNGPQRVFVDLAYTPWVYSLDGRGALVTHTGRDCGAIARVWLDEAGTMILLGDPGPGVVDDRDLMVLSDRLVDRRGRSIEDECVARLIASQPGSEPEIRLEYLGARIRLERIDSGAVAELLNFDPRPGANTVETGTT